MDSTVEKTNEPLCLINSVDFVKKPMNNKPTQFQSSFIAIHYKYEEVSRGLISVLFIMTIN